MKQATLLFDAPREEPCAVEPPPADASSDPEERATSDAASKAAAPASSDAAKAPAGPRSKAARIITLARSLGVQSDAEAAGQLNSNAPF